MRLVTGNVIQSIHTGNAFTVEYVSADGHFFILRPREGEKSRGYDMNDFKRSFVKVPNDSMQQPVSNRDELPVTKIKPVADLYGITSPTGSETSFTFDAIEARNFIDGGWSCQEYVELERYQQACADNAPVIPDGYVMVPIEPTAEMYDAGDRQMATKQVWDAMIEAAPQQEAKP